MQQNYLKYCVLIILAGLTFNSCVRAPQSSSWQDDVVYFLLLDRFHNGDPSNDSGNNPASHVLYTGDNPAALKTYQGGDIKGVIDGLDYLESLGITAIWISPFFNNSDSDFEGWWPYHGYHPIDFYQVDEHFGTIADLQNLVKAAHRRGIKVIFDMVFNQTAQDHPWVHDSSKSDWFHRQPNGAPYPITDWYDQQQIERGALQGMPDLNQENPEVADYLIRMSKFWVAKTDCDGFRLDAIKHIAPRFWRQFDDALHQSEGKDFILLGEVFWGEPERFKAYLNLGLDALFDIPGYYAIKNTFARSGSIRELSAFRKSAAKNYGREALATLIDNHDVTRFNTGIKHNARAKQLLALTYLFTTPGIPVLYYGTEIGLPGAPVNNPQTGVSQDYLNRLMFPDSLTLDQKKQLAHVRQLIRLRKHYPTLATGVFFELYQDWGEYVYLRATADENLLVILNNAETPETVTFPRQSGRYALDEIGSRLYGTARIAIEADSILVTVPPYGAAIWPVTGTFDLKQPWAQFTNRLTGDYIQQEFNLAVPGLDPEQWSIAGDFSNWKPVHYPVIQQGDTLTMTIPLRSGTYQYKFILNGKTWLPDENAKAFILDPYGGRNSVVKVVKSQN